MLSARDVEQHFEPDEKLSAFNSFSSSHAPTINQAAFHGLAGEIVRAIEPFSEADPVALLLNSLTAFGNIVGCSSHALVQNDQHPGRLFVAEVGQTSKGRKGTAWSPIKHLFSLVDSDWSKQRVKSGLSSGEGLIFNVRDTIYKQEPVKEKGRVVDYQEVMIDPGEDDKRLLVVEPEFASTLTVMNRDGSILSAVIRQAWDDGQLSPLTRNNPIKSTGAHISLLGHITQHELLCQLDETSKANGFANRFLWILVRRSKELPEGATIPDELNNRLAERLRAAVDFARHGGVVRRDDTAREAWARVYGPLSAGKLGLTGAATSRAEAQVLRLSVLYALLECSLTVSIHHLRAALAVWEFAEDSAKAIFGDRLGDPVADRILDALRSTTDGMSESNISNLFGRNRSASDIERAMRLLNESHLIRSQTFATKGRPRTLWWATK